ncbi:MAG: flagellar biosynthesis protein FliS [Marinovum sp.]|nr:flagellar biosynthesis protein FliS [Marinovum sp.]|tara:strand:- start:7326 stop:7733 length:408 start_codon:yes stop_codon:yes gene_type:complete
MNYSSRTQAYQNAERQALEETNDPHLIIMTMLDALVKSMIIFADNVDLKNGGNAELKSKHFSRALSMIYALQTSLDFEKGGDIANNLFQLYEFSRVKLIEDLSGGVAEGTPQAIDVMSSIRDAWNEMGKQISDEK